MPIITFWSNREKETAQTLSMISIASYLAVENNSKILIIDTNINRTCFLERKKFINSKSNKAIKCW